MKGGVRVGECTAPSKNKMSGGGAWWWVPRKTFLICHETFINLSVQRKGLPCQCSLIRFCRVDTHGTMWCIWPDNCSFLEENCAIIAVEGGQADLPAHPREAGWRWVIIGILKKTSLDHPIFYLKSFSAIIFQVFLEEEGVFCECCEKNGVFSVKY